jgi:hypothetical protein
MGGRTSRASSVSSAAAAEDLVEAVEVGGAVAEEDVDGGVAWAVALRLGVAAELVEREAHRLVDRARAVDEVLEAHGRR